jgi:hypothetical protein
VLHFNGQVLDNRFRLSDYNIVEGSLLQLLDAQASEPAAPTTILVETPAGLSVALQVNPLDTVKSVKQMLEFHVGSACTEMTLLATLPDEWGIGTFGMHTGAQLHLRRQTPMRLSVLVKLQGGRLLCFDMAPTDTLEALKGQLSEGLNVPAGEMELLMESGARLEGEKTFQEYGIWDREVLRLEMCVPTRC